MKEKHIKMDQIDHDNQNAYETLQPFTLDAYEGNNMIKKIG